MERKAKQNVSVDPKNPENLNVPIFLFIKDVSNHPPQKNYYYYITITTKIINIAWKIKYISKYYNNFISQSMGLLLIKTSNALQKFA